MEALSESSLMEHFTYVSHQSYLFKGTVRDNLRMARARCRRCCSLAGSGAGQSGFLPAQPAGAGHDSPGKGRQFLRRPVPAACPGPGLLHGSPVYIFDEATSNIDVESENEIMAQIHTLAKTKTVILISHRLANVAGADNIYVLDRGTVVEHGTHRALLAENGTYAKLWQAQQELENMTKGGDAE